MVRLWHTLPELTQIYTQLYETTTDHKELDCQDLNSLQFWRATSWNYVCKLISTPTVTVFVHHFEETVQSSVVILCYSNIFCNCIVKTFTQISFIAYWNWSVFGSMDNGTVCILVIKVLDLESEYLKHLYLTVVGCPTQNQPNSVEYGNTQEQQQMCDIRTALAKSSSDKCNREGC